MGAKETAMLEAVLARVGALEEAMAAKDVIIAELRATIATLTAENKALRARNAAQERTIAELRARLERYEATALAAPIKDSRNSDLPPSRDPIGHGRGPAKRIPNPEGRGGQKGHTGRTASRIEPDRVIDVTPTSCSCGACLDGIPGRARTTRQVQDVVVTRDTTDYTGEVKNCPDCGVLCEPDWPATATAAVAYGPGVRATAIGLDGIGLLPSRVVARLMAGFYGVPLSAQTVAEWTYRLGASLDGWDTAVRDLVRSSPTVHVDETGYKVADVPNSWMHVAATPTLTVFHLGTRSKDSIRAGGIVQGYDGVLVSDCLPSYWAMDVTAHQACTVHLERELRFLDQFYAPTTGEHPLPGLASLIGVLSGATHDRSQSPELLVATVTALAAGLLSSPQVTGRNPDTKLAALAKRLVKLARSGDLFRFLTVPGVEPTNNAAEQAIRFAKIRTRRSMTARSLPHARSAVRVAAYLDTARKNGKDPDWALREALAGRPFIPVR